MSIAFRALLQKIGSGPHTSESLSRDEAAAATRMMLLQEATPAQIGAFLIAHRIKRPTGTELAGMLDAYEDLGPRLSPPAVDHPVLVMGIPYDGRTRTAPLAPITALILATLNRPVLMHGGERMPTKSGETLINVWQALGVDWRSLSLADAQAILTDIGVGCLYLPQHFPLAQGLVGYREEIGKRPPLATLELIWSPYAGSDSIHLVPGFVHPPTETMFAEALGLRGVRHWTTVKGLEGSCDLPRERTAIIGLFRPGFDNAEPTTTFERLHLHPRDYGFAGSNVPLEPLSQTFQQMQDTLMGVESEYLRSQLWNSGFYLWQSGVTTNMESGIELARELLQRGKVFHKLQQLQAAIAKTTKA